MPRSLYNRIVRPVSRRESAVVTIPPCPVCANTAADRAFTVEGMAEEVVTCRQCGLGILFPQPDRGRILSFYPEEYYGDAGEKFQGLVELMVRVITARQARYVSAGLKRGARVLDFGCGRGVLLRALAARGCEAHGVEMQRKAAGNCDSPVQIRIASRLVEAAYPDDYFERVVLWHVLEHLPDPRETLAEVHRILQPGGKAIIAVPNFSSYQARWAGADWFHLDLPRHLYHFPLPALKRLLENCGFACGAVHHFSLRQNAFGWLQSALNKYTPLPRNALYELLHRRAPGGGPPFDRRTRLCLRTAFYLGAPPALLAAVVAAGLRGGATVHVEAEKRGT